VPLEASSRRYLAVNARFLARFFLYRRFLAATENDRPRSWIVSRRDGETERKEETCLSPGAEAGQLDIDFPLNVSRLTPIDHRSHRIRVSLPARWNARTRAVDHRDDKISRRRNATMAITLAGKIIAV